MIAGVMEAMNALNTQSNSDVWTEGYWILSSIMEPIIPHVSWDISQRYFSLNNLSKQIVLEEVFIDDGSLIISSKIGRYSTIGKNNQIFYADIGNFVSISWNVTVGAIQHEIKTLTTHAFPYTSAFNISDTNDLSKTKTKIGHDVWIGAGVIIMSGITIGNGVIVGAGTIVTKDIEAYSVVAGNPNKLLYMRFSQDMCKELENLKWWYWDKSQIQNNISHFKENLTIEIIRKIKNNLEG
jgi:acetyltransferase-like isoleucine patch superfamily enzyme